ncbi:unnamed protein product [Spirodela intermedia]|uniref:RING-type E3 ubiquitin transferase n=1 Tax=Spirodela intermedia TaxID=51605 RepID=A0A7I8IFA5_SPIIN|nr:unnamed protein product [Spirodela intermedia]CAA6655552.1 unnamed protein product [Spirodela intermedia]
MATSNARSGLSSEGGEEVEGDEGGGEESEEEEQEENEEENSDEDYAPPETVQLNRRLRMWIYIHPLNRVEGRSVNVDTTEGRGSEQRAGDEVIDVSEDSENDLLKVVWEEHRRRNWTKRCLGQPVSNDPDLLLPNCPICMERWAGQGVHRVCMIGGNNVSSLTNVEEYLGFVNMILCILWICFPDSFLQIKIFHLRKKLLDEVIKLKKDAEDYTQLGPAWSCSWDSNASYHIYAGLQNGMLLMFDIRQTSSPLESRPGLSSHPIHTIHSLPPQPELHGAGALLTASAVGPCLWDTGTLPETENQGVCISLACGGSGTDAVASFRPLVHTGVGGGGGAGSTALTGPVRLGTHVLLKRVDGRSFRRHEAASGNVSDVRMCRSAIVHAEGGGTAFVYGDEASHGLSVWDIASFQVVKRLKPHEHPILDVKFSKYASGPGLLGCISENKIQVFRVP